MEECPKCECIRVFTRLRGGQTCQLFAEMSQKRHRCSSPEHLNGVVYCGFCHLATSLRVWLLLSMGLGSLGFLRSQLTTNTTPWLLRTSPNSSNFISFNFSFFSLLPLFRLSSLTFSHTSMEKKVGSLSNVAFFFLLICLGLFCFFSFLRNKLACVWWVLHIY